MNPFETQLAIERDEQVRARAVKALLELTFTALDTDSTRWWADETGVERCKFVRAHGDAIIVCWKGQEYPMDPQRVFCNPTDAQLHHETLRSNAEARCYQSTEE